MTSKAKRAQGKTRLADMSLPPEQRHRKRTVKGRGGKGRIAQMDHANHSEANKRRRKFWKKEGRE
jgi:phage gp16-like protein